MKYKNLNLSVDHVLHLMADKIHQAVMEDRPILHLIDYGAIDRAATMQLMYRIATKDQYRFRIMDLDNHDDVYNTISGYLLGVKSKPVILITGLDDKIHQLGRLCSSEMELILVGVKSSASGRRSNDVLFNDNNVEWRSYMNTEHECAAVADMISPEYHINDLHGDLLEYRTDVASKTEALWTVLQKNFNSSFDIEFKTVISNAIMYVCGNYGSWYMTEDGQGTVALQRAINELISNMDNMDNEFVLNGGLDQRLVNIESKIFDWAAYTVAHNLPVAEFIELPEATKHYTLYGALLELNGSELRDYISALLYYSHVEYEYGLSRQYDKFLKECYQIELNDDNIFVQKMLERSGIKLAYGKYIFRYLSIFDYDFNNYHKAIFTDKLLKDNPTSIFVDVVGKDKWHQVLHTSIEYYQVTIRSRDESVNCGEIAEENGGFDSDSKHYGEFTIDIK